VAVGVKIISEARKSFQFVKKVYLAKKKAYSPEQSHRGVCTTLKAYNFLINP